MRSINYELVDDGMLEMRLKEHKSPQWPFQAILGLSSATTGTIRRATVKTGPQKAKWLTNSMFFGLEEMWLPFQPHPVRHLETKYITVQGIQYSYDYINFISRHL